MDNPARPTLVVTIPSSERTAHSHGSTIEQMALQSAPPELLSRVSFGDKGLRRRHREDKGKSRDGIFRHRMQQASSRQSRRGSLSTYRERDSEDHGLLQPSTREISRSRWGSGSTGMGSGSRRESVFDGLDKDIRLGSIKRPDKIHSMSDLQRVRDRRSRGEEYLRSALSAIGTLATDITRRLDYTYYGLLEKIAALNVTIASFQDLSDSTSKLFEDFQHETKDLEQEIRKQIGDIHDFQPQMQKIDALEERMRVSKTRAKALGNRLQAMRSEVEKWDKRETEWQMRTNQRLRLFWAVVTTAILAVLVGIVVQHWPSNETETASGFRTLSRALKIPNVSSRVSVSKQLGTSQGHSNVLSSPGPSMVAHNGTTTEETENMHTSTRPNEATISANYDDPLRILDNL